MGYELVSETRNDGGHSRYSPESSEMPSRKESVNDILDGIRFGLVERQEAMRDSVRTFEALSTNAVTLPRMRDEYRKRVVEATELLTMIDRELESLDRMSEVREVETDSGIFRFVFESHELRHSPEVLRDLDAYAMEAVASDLGQTIERKPDGEDGPLFFPTDERNLIGTNRPIVDVIREARLPLYFCDVAGSTLSRLANGENAREQAVVDAVAAAAVASGGFVAAWNAIKALQERGSSGMSRRTFLKTGAKAIGGLLFAAGGYGIRTDFGENRNDLHQDDSLLGEYWRRRQELFCRFGMLRFLIELRNLVMAQKLHCIAERERKRGVVGKPRIGMEIGSGHDRVREAIRMPEDERVAAIRKLLEDAEIVLESPDDEVAALFEHTYSDEDGRREWLSRKIIDSAISEAFKDYPYRNPERTGVTSSKDELVV